MCVFVRVCVRVYVGCMYLHYVCMCSSFCVCKGTRGEGEQDEGGHEQCKNADVGCKHSGYTGRLVQKNMHGMRE